MIIVIVTDLYNSTNNGTTVSARRLVEALEERGHEVRLICSGTEGKNRYILPTYQHGLIPKVASWNGMVFCKPIDSIIAKQSTNVDTVSGATYSSVGIIQAVRDALSQAAVNGTSDGEGERNSLYDGYARTSAARDVQCWYE